MAMHGSIEPVLHPLPIRDLRPTQMTVGMREVHRKQAEWRDRKLDEKGDWLGGHMVPVVIGPGATPWVIDHHHLVRALHDEGVQMVLVSVVAKLDLVPKKRFFAFMEAGNWLHCYDDNGRRRDWADLPRHVGKLVDDPHRSLAGELRRSGGYAKSSAPYTEFLWADFLRDRIKRAQVEDKFEKAIAKALVLARSHHASYLPGFAGPEHGVSPGTD